MMHVARVYFVCTVQLQDPGIPSGIADVSNKAQQSLSCIALPACQSVYPVVHI